MDGCPGPVAEEKGSDSEGSRDVFSQVFFRPGGCLY